MKMSSIITFLRVTCFKDWQSTAPPSVTWSAKMTACVYPWIISLCPKKITVSSTTLTKTWSQRRWNGVKEEIIMIWWEATRWRWEIESWVVDRIVLVFLLTYIFITTYRACKAYLYRKGSTVIKILVIYLDFHSTNEDCIWLILSHMPPIKFKCIPTRIQLRICCPRAEYNSMFLPYDCLRESLNI